MEPRPVLAGNMYNREVAIRNLWCIDPPMGCGRRIDHLDYHRWSVDTKKEYVQTGWCRACQDKFFRDPDEAPDRCTCDDEPCCSVDVGVGILTCGDQHRRACPQHNLVSLYNYDPDMREEDPPEDIHEVEWSLV